MPISSPSSCTNYKERDDWEASPASPKWPAIAGKQPSLIGEPSESTTVGVDAKRMEVDVTFGVANLDRAPRRALPLEGWGNLTLFLG